MSRDPEEEDGGINLYEFALNDPLNKFDNVGLIGQGDKLPLTDGNGDAWIYRYHADPPSGHWSDDYVFDIGVGARLIVVPEITTCPCGSEYHWRQFKTDNDPNSFFNHAPDPAGAIWYPDDTKDTEYYIPQGNCLYSFLDHPRKVPPPSIPKDTVLLDLQLVKVDTQKFTQTIVLEITWGYWYTTDHKIDKLEIQRIK